MRVYLVNETSEVSDISAARCAAAVDHQLRHEFASTGWRSDARCYFTPGGADARVPSGGIILHLVDNMDVQGALGYHDETGNEVPYAKIGVQTAIADGQTWTEVVSHEALELVADPNVNLSALTGDGSKLFAFEVCDPCQGNPYVGINGVTLADFVLPSYFDPNTGANVGTDYVGALKGPFSLATQGYYSYIEMTNPSAGWQQGFGQERVAAPAWATRHAQRAGGPEA